MIKTTLLLLFASICSFLPAQPGDIQVNLWTTGLTQPVDLTHAGDTRIFVVERAGRILILDQMGNIGTTPYLDIRAQVHDDGGEQGLLGLAFHPEYRDNGYFFVYYIGTNDQTIVSRFSVDPNNPDLADPNSEAQVLTFSQPFTNHNAGDLEFDNDGNLLIASGDGGSGGDPFNNSQNDSTLLGKILRINVDSLPYTIPPNNPFAYYNNGGQAPEILALGLRNPWRMAIDPVTNYVWIGDVGQDNREEIDVLRPNDIFDLLNFGWKCYEANLPYNTNNCGNLTDYIGPVFDYESNLPTGCSVTGGRVYRGARYKSLWDNYIFGDYCSGYLWFTPNASGLPGPTQIINDFSYQFSAFGEDFYGQLYTFNYSNGNVYRIEDTTCTPAAYIRGGAEIFTCDNAVELAAIPHPGLTYQWYLNGTAINGATDSIYSATQSGAYTVMLANGNCSDLSPVATLRMNEIETRIVGLDTAYEILNGQVALFGIPDRGTFTGPGVVNNGFFDPALAGQGVHTIVYTVTDGNCTGQDSIQVTVGFTNREDDRLWANLSVFPNPGTGLFRVKMDVRSGRALEVDVFDVAGRKIQAYSPFVSAGAFQMDLDLRGVATGMYLLRVRDGQSMETVRIQVD